ncbi:MAG: hypothetical protein IKN15_04870 [Bacteroidaceae bacterium]|nr:hypothetical protein [Bacteroidaceae bacterium]
MYIIKEETKESIMPAKINVTKDIKKAFDATSRAISDIGLYASSALFNVTPDGVFPRRVLAKAERTFNEGLLSVTVAYSLENIPAHGTWYFNFVFNNSIIGSGCSVTVTRTNSFGIYTKSCKFDQEALDEIVKEIAEE